MKSVLSHRQLKLLLQYIKHFEYLLTEIIYIYKTYLNAHDDYIRIYVVKYFFRSFFYY